jgi:hypothetical protein
MHAVKLEKNPRAENVKITMDFDLGADHFLNSYKILINTGFQPGDDGRKTSGSRFNGLGCRKTRRNGFHSP